MPSVNACLFLCVCFFFICRVIFFFFGFCDREKTKNEIGRLVKSKNHHADRVSGGKVGELNRREKCVTRNNNQNQNSAFNKNNKPNVWPYPGEAE